MKCNDCGKTLESNSKFCTHCGTQVPQNNNQQTKDIENTIPLKQNTLLLKILKVVSYMIFIFVITVILGAFVDTYNWVSIIWLVLLYLGYIFVVSDKRTITGIIVFTILTILLKVVLTVMPIVFLAQGNKFLNTPNDDPYMEKIRTDAIDEKAKLDRLCGDDLDCRMRLFSENTEKEKVRKKQKRSNLKIINYTHPKSEPDQLFIVNFSYENKIKTYRVYCPSEEVRDITNSKWGKARKAYVEDKVRYENKRVIRQVVDKICN